MAGLYLVKLIPDISKSHGILGTGTGDNGVKKMCIQIFCLLLAEWSCHFS